jgi:hypothetical protein
MTENTDSIEQSQDLGNWDFSNPSMVLQIGTARTLSSNPNVNGNMSTNTNMNNKSASSVLLHRASAKGLLIVSLSRYFSEGGRIHRILPYITGESNISLRLIDWFVTNYTRKHNVVLWSHGVHLNVFMSYRAQLKAYSKQQFDPFRRRDRIIFVYDDNRSVETTVGQLNFFRWMHENSILDFVDAHSLAIEADMVLGQSSRRNCDEDDDAETVKFSHGPVGPLVNMGPIGPLVNMGSTGPTGPTGHAVPMGHAGPTGPMGHMGPMGPMGNMGPMGPMGNMGNIGCETSIERGAVMHTYGSTTISFD